MKPQKEMPGANPSYQLFGGFNAFFSPTWQKTRVGLVSRMVFYVWCILGHPKGATSTEPKFKFQSDSDVTGTGEPNM